MGRSRFEYFTWCIVTSQRAGHAGSKLILNEKLPSRLIVNRCLLYFFGQKLVERVYVYIDIYVYKVPQTPHQISKNQKQKRVKRFCAKVRIWVQHPCCHAQTAGARFFACHMTCALTWSTLQQETCKVIFWGLVHYPFRRPQSAAVESMREALHGWSGHFIHANDWLN